MAAPGPDFPHLLGENVTATCWKAVALKNIAPTSSMTGQTEITAPGSVAAKTRRPTVNNLISLAGGRLIRSARVSLAA